MYYFLITIALKPVMVWGLDFKKPKSIIIITKYVYQKRKVQREVRQFICVIFQTPSLLDGVFKCLNRK